VNRITVCLGTLVLLLAAVACSGKRSGPEANAVQQQTDPTSSSIRPPPGGNATLPQITIESIAVSPQDPHKGTTLTATIKTIPPALPGDVQLSFVFWVNASIVQKDPQNVLLLDKCKKSDLVYVDAVLTSGERELARKRSEMIGILNSSPQIESIVYPEIKGPGKYSIKINALDTDDDPLIYSLEGDDLPKEVSIDQSGVIRFVLTDKPPESVAFFVVVKDNQEGEVRQEIKVNLQKPVVQK